MQNNILQKTQEKQLRSELINKCRISLKSLSIFAVRSLTLTELIVLENILHRLRELKAVEQVNPTAQNTDELLAR